MHNADYKVLSAIERLPFWNKQEAQVIEDGAGPLELAATNNANPKDATATANATDAQAQAQAITDQAKSVTDANSLSKFQAILKSKAVGATGAVVIGCMMEGIAANLPQLQQTQVIKPMERIGQESISTGGQLENGNSDSSLDQLGFMNTRLYNATDKTSVTDARSIQAGT